MTSSTLAPFHLALRTDIGEVEALRRVLDKLHEARAFELHAEPGARGELVALVTCKDVAAAKSLTPMVKKLAEPLRVGVVELHRIDKEALSRFEAVVGSMRVKVRGQPLDAAFNELRRSLSGPPLLKLSYASEAALLEAWSRHVTEGGIWVNSSRAPAAQQLRVQLEVGERALEPVHGQVGAMPPPRGADKGFWVILTASGALSELVSRAVHAERQGRRAPVTPDSRRVHERFVAALEVKFDDFPGLQTEYVSNISRGGLFVRTATPPDMGAKVKLTLSLPDGEQVTLDAEVVHRVPPEDAAARGGVAGVGVSFAKTGPKTFAPIERLLEQFAQRRPRVLLIDGDLGWRAKLASALTAAGLDVDLVANGLEGMLVLTEFFFDIDLVISDLASPLSGFELVERIRSLGGELGLKVLLLTDEPADASRHVTGPTWTASRRMEMDELVKLVCAQVGLVR